MTLQIICGLLSAGMVSLGILYLVTVYRANKAVDRYERAIKKVNGDMRVAFNAGRLSVFQRKTSHKAWLDYFNEYGIRCTGL